MAFVPASAGGAVKAAAEAQANVTKRAVLAIFIRSDIQPASSAGAAQWHQI
jgi:hypothetical protein